MKKILKGSLILLFIILLSACTKDYKAITYTRFKDVFASESNYFVDDEILILDREFERHIEATGNNNQFTYYEFETKEAAREYVKTRFKDEKNFKYKDKKSYIIVQNKKGGYFYLIQVENIVIIGNTNITSNKNEIKRIFKKLGY